MKVLRNGRDLKKIKSPVLTLGNFDGLHIGHQRIIRKVSQRAKALRCPSVVYTFEPHPLKVVAPHKSPPIILETEDKKRLIESLGIDFLVFAKFTREFASRHPGEFVEDVLVRGLNVREVWVGHDYAFGRGKSGTVDYLKKLGREFGFRVNVIPAYKRGGHVISSSRVRSLISHGDVKGAKGLLGRFYTIKGKVVRGKDIGKEIGFPTANLKVVNELIPSRGVYTAYASVNGKTLQAVVNIGTSPTFGGRDTAVEVHILDFTEDLYGKKIEVLFVRRLRDEKTFGSGDELARNIEKDIRSARKILSRTQAGL